LVHLYPEQTVIGSKEQEPIEEKKAAKVNPATSRWKRLVVEVGRFGVVGVFNTLLDLFLFNVLLWMLPTHNTLHILAYNSIAYSIGAINSFLLNKYWTFRRSYAVTRSEVVRFLLTTGAGIVCSDLILWVAGLLLSHVGGNAVLLNNLAKILAVAGTASVSYLGMHLWVFVRKSEV
jgi:putative flippase GtrA